MEASEVRWIFDSLSLAMVAQPEWEVSQGSSTTKHTGYSVPNASHVTQHFKFTNVTPLITFCVGPMAYFGVRDE